MTDDQKAPLTAHLEELRSRIIKCFIAVGIGFAVSYAFKEQLFDYLMQPLRDALPYGDRIIFTGLPEAFFTYLKVAFLSGLLLASPVILYQLWMFVAPGLYKQEKKFLMPIIVLSVFFFLGGALFGYFVVFPFGFSFFLSFANPSIQALPSMKEYLGFASKMLLAFGFVFELPLFITGLARMGVVSVGFLNRNRKYAILLFFIFGAILTPPDIVSQVMLACPLMVLYEISICGAWLFGKKNRAPEAEA
ncbi:MAG: twin-arginine translocase subunit TatC [Deltaproteobacteria bacterium]|nr:MAG: twin-arginine translocase subunit TatC [Deltaproteobacteria bacterium]